MNTTESIIKEYRLKFNEVLTRMYNLEIVPNIQATINERIPERGGFQRFENAELEQFIKEALERVREELVKELVIIRDVELRDNPMMKNRAAYNLNVLINSLGQANKSDCACEGTLGGAKHSKYDCQKGDLGIMKANKDMLNSSKTHQTEEINKDVTTNEEKINVEKIMKSARAVGKILREEEKECPCHCHHNHSFIFCPSNMTTCEHCQEA